MRILRDLNFISERPCVLALGCFDGVHLGHKAVINKAKSIADTHGIPLTVFTFEQPPKNFFSKYPIPLITSTEDKLELLDRLGVSTAVCLPLSAEVLSVTAEDFINDIILKKLLAKHVVCGYDYSFGKSAAGNASLIKTICEKEGVGLTVIPEQKLDNMTISSSLIRDLVLEGDVKSASIYLGRPFSLSSTVVDGQHLARKLGFPTVNLIPKEGLLLPKNGVYVTQARFADTCRYGITNVGVRPTVNTRIMCAETHIFDFDGDLYGQKITLDFFEYLRPELKFDSIESMSKQIYKDILLAKAYINKM